MCSRRGPTSESGRLGISRKRDKFGIELHENVEQALALDAKNGNILWTDAISKEMVNVRVTFEVLPDGKSVP